MHKTTLGFIMIKYCILVSEHNRLYKFMISVNNRLQCAGQKAKNYISFHRGHFGHVEILKTEHESLYLRHSLFCYLFSYIKQANKAVL